MSILCRMFGCLLVGQNSYLQGDLLPENSDLRIVYQVHECSRCGKTTTERRAETDREKYPGGYEDLFTIERARFRATGDHRNPADYMNI